MPELPEVEHVRQRLTLWLSGSRVLACEVTDARLPRPGTPRAVVRGLVGRRIERVDRRGKWLRIALDDGARLFVHLAMTGWFELAPDDTRLRFERARITARTGKTKRPTHVAYIDPRRWGRWLLTKDDIPMWTALAADPLTDEIDPGEIHAKLARRKRSSIKEAIMDQRVIAGVGNIQAIEALWRARIDPRAVASTLTEKDVRALLTAIDWTIARTLADLAKGAKGKDDPFLIYGHVGKPCPRCKTVLSRIELGGRTTTFCTGCQRRVAKGRKAATR